MDERAIHSSMIRLRVWLLLAARLGAILTFLVLAAVLGLSWHARNGTRLRLEFVSGRAAAALGDSGVFAMHGAPPGILPKLPLADAESAAVADAYRFAPTHWITRGREILERPSERRHVCGRAFYMRPVISVPDSLSAQRITTDLTLLWGPVWIVPVCNDAGIAETTVAIADAPTELRVTLGDQPEDVPELNFPRDLLRAHIVWTDPTRSIDWDRGIALSPETAGAVASATLKGTGARVNDVPEAFHVVLSSRDGESPDSIFQSATQPPACLRWRLTLDRPVLLRGRASGQIARTNTVYVARGPWGCDRTATMQIPRPLQPRTIHFLYDLWRHKVGSKDPRPEHGGNLSSLFKMRSTIVPVREPLWFEPAELVRSASSRSP